MINLLIATALVFSIAGLGLIHFSLMKWICDKLDRIERKLDEP